MTSREHSVQFYESGWFLHRAVQTFFDRALEERQPCVMISTRETYDAVIGGLVASHGGMSDSIHSIRFVEAASALDSFMDGHTPDPVRFDKALMPLWDDLRPGAEGAVHVYGEMADLLCAADNHQGALRLEQLGERLMQDRPVSILCTYGLERFDHDVDARMLRAVCRHHTEILPAGSVTEAPDERTRSEHVVVLQHRSRVLDGLERNRIRDLTNTTLALPVCVIEDDASIRRSIERILVLNGLRVRVFASAEAFLVEGVAAGCLILDAQLPGMSGLELQKLMASMGETVPIITMSGSTDARLERESRALGATAFLRKPFDADCLIGEVLRALRSQGPRRIPPRKRDN
jgi:FixJ family two-component response regulator